MMHDRFVQFRYNNFPLIKDEKSIEIPFLYLSTKKKIIDKSMSY